MTREKAKSLIAAIVTLREGATDAQALAAKAAYPTWREDSGYKTGQRVLHEGILYKVLLDHTAESTWPPDKAPALFAKVLIPDEGTIPAWEQPDSTNAYMAGDKVTHNGKTWVSDIDNNVWEPGVYGWSEVTA